MKYMGSKRSMLLNGLGEAIAEMAPSHRRFVDLFTGSGAVAWHVAQRYDLEVLAGDLQQFCVVLAASVISRTKPLGGRWLEDWITAAETNLHTSPILVDARRIQQTLCDADIERTAKRARKLCQTPSAPIFNAYGGYYFSPLQALSLDALRTTLPRQRDVRPVALASLIWVASRCAASPGHTAQPFKPNKTAGKYLKEAWCRDVCGSLRQSYGAIAPLYSRRKGQANKSDARALAAEMKEGDLAFIDPPYSGVHYSRFYHVLETIAIHDRVSVSGEGRYPPRELRPQSKYSVQTASRDALTDLLKTLSLVGSSAIITFPAGHASNGLSGRMVKEIAGQFFRIKSTKITSRFSTLGGNLRNRDARQSSDELILTLTPRG
jgi:adenine-specific DNA methylase